jgi:uracil-DNA glycosylase
MKINQFVECKTFPCLDVNHSGYLMPEIDLDPEKVRVILISEAAPQNRQDDYYAQGQSLFAQTTVQAFQDAGIAVDSIEDILDRGVYLTTAIKCSKTTYNIKTETIKNCIDILDVELSLFPNVHAYLLMGDVAISAINYIAKRAGERRVIPAGSTYKLRGPVYAFRGARVFPSYLQAGPSFYIEKSKRKMIAQDISEALQI